MKKTFFIFLSLMFLVAGPTEASDVISKNRAAKRKPPPQNQNNNRPRPSQRNRPAQPLPPQAEEEILDIVDVWRELDYSSEIWLLIVERKHKEITIREYIKLYNERGIRILKKPTHYVDFIDGLLIGRSEMIQMPFKDVFRFAAVIEYDFDNGQNKDQMALRLLGQKAYEDNRRRLNR